MNILIAIMSEQYGRLNNAKEQNTLKEMCKMMQDHIWVFKPFEVYGQNRYILMLGPNRITKNESAVEKKIIELQEYVDERVNKSDSDIIKHLATLDEQLIALQSQESLRNQETKATCKKIDD